MWLIHYSKRMQSDRSARNANETVADANRVGLERPRAEAVDEAGTGPVADVILGDQPDLARIVHVEGNAEQREAVALVAAR